MTKPLDIIILAGGRGSRLGYDIPKPLLLLNKKTLLSYVLDVAVSLRPRRIITVVPTDSNLIKNEAVSIFNDVEFAVQEKPFGTGDAAMAGVKLLDDDGIVLVLCADTPFLKTSDLKKTVTAVNNCLSIMIFSDDNSCSYGRVIRKQDGAISIIENLDLNVKQSDTNEVFSGVMAGDCQWMRENLPELNCENKAGEFYLTGLCELAGKKKYKVATVLADKGNSVGINTVFDFENAKKLIEVNKQFNNN